MKLEEDNSIKKEHYLTSKLTKKFIEIKKEAVGKIDEAIQRFLNENDLSWVDFKEHGKIVRDVNDPFAVFYVLYRDKEILEIQFEIQQGGLKIKMECSITELYKYAQSES